ncbi:MAG: aldehyde ferredoxin oxidoreductase family protein [Pseudomonadota bacterium]
MIPKSRKYLRVNLTAGIVKEEEIPSEVIMDFIGGRGFGIKYLYDELSPNVDPLGPSNKLIILTGPLAGSGAQSCSRWMVITKSPLTGAYIRSAGGADFGAALNLAGYDFILCEGRAEKPVYLYVERGKRELKDAEELWGLDTRQTQERLKSIHGKKVRTACIGPAGENGVLYSGVVSDRRICARGGVGTVMGSKNLKAVTTNATGPLDLPDPGEFKKLIREEIEGIKAGQMFQSFSEYGTPGVVDHMVGLGIFPVRNFRKGTVKGFEKINADAFKKLKVKNEACFGCLIHCGNIFKVTEGPYAGSESAPDYESIWAFSGPIENNEIGAIIAADALCDDLGLDTISTGNTIGFAFELFEKGIITTKDTDGLELTYGDHKTMIQLIEKTAKREGFGDLLAEGTRIMAKKIGGEAFRYAMHVKGLEMPAYDPRAAKNQGLNYATSVVGANHNIGYSYQEIFNSPIPRPVDRFSEKEKGDLCKWNQDVITVGEFGIACAFPVGMGMLPPDMLSKLIASATGIKEFGTPECLFEAAERVYDLERAFNIREGFQKSDDTLPERVQKEPLLEAEAATGQTVSKLEEMVKEYYKGRGWTEEGFPPPEKLRNLGLERAARDIETIMKG